MASFEQHDDISIIETNRAEQEAIELAMRAIGATSGDVGEGIVRTREALRE